MNMEQLAEIGQRISKLGGTKADLSCAVDAVVNQADSVQDIGEVLNRIRWSLGVESEEDIAEVTERATEIVAMHEAAARAYNPFGKTEGMGRWL